MSYLAVDTLESPLFVNMRVTETTCIKTVRLKLYKNDVIIDGSIQLSIFNGLDLLAVKSITYEELNPTGKYAYGYFAFELDESVVVNKADNVDYIELSFKVEMVNHTPSNDNYMALVRNHERPFVKEYGTRPAPSNPNDDCWLNPYGVELYSVVR